MSWELLWWFPVWGPLLLALLYGIIFGVFSRGDPEASAPAWVMIPMMPVLLVAALLDVILNFTVMNLYLLDPWPKKGEWTISKRLTRLNARTGLLGAIPRALTAFLDALDSLGRHVKPN